MKNTMIVEFDVEEVCQLAGLQRTYLIEIVAHGIVEPHGERPENWRFDQRSLHLLRRAARLSRELELDWTGVALAIDLLDELERLRSENSHLRRRLGRFEQD
ncbi:chaperone modulator CbpM [Zestomonas carbonaria]|uniref:Chaperone modulatory protein CbpM n=1 Tax=Zestomonas carbonaria TaxID=2762745 RepID=A0A7U7I895_9GAMM|nr:chaperone modulator CbpM [Pseudomonas carbonaria]CAD5107020.1 Chaperone modulatory protein CbpM [Pseudomonas carbonaria]